jgi:hypothetical protein
MPLSAPVEREHHHTRAYDFKGFRRSDGLWDIEGHLTDAKTYSFTNRHRGRIEAGEPVHDMWIRLTIDETFRVHAIEAATDAGPFAVCPAIIPNFQKVVGMKIGPGWRQALRRELGGIEGCTHLVEMLGAMATVAYQTLFPTLARKSREASGDGAAKGAGTAPKRPALIDSCHAYASDGEVVRHAWPEWYTGPRQRNSGGD